MSRFLKRFGDYAYYTQQLLCNFLVKTLGKYLDGIPESLSLSLLRGKIELKDLTLRADAFESLHLPVDIVGGFIGSLKLSISWTRILNQPLEISIEDMYVLCNPSTRSVYDADQLQLNEIRLKKAVLKAAEMFLGRQGDETESQREAGSSTLLQRLLERFLDSLQFSVRRVHLRLECPINAELNAIGVTIERLFALSADDSWSVSKPENQTSTGHLLRKRCEVQSLTWYVDCDVMPLTISSGEKRSVVWMKAFDSVSATQTHEFVLQPFNASLHMCVSTDANPAERGVPRLSCQVHMDAVDVSLGKQQYRCVVQVLGTLSLYMRRARHLKHGRPKLILGVGARAAACDWWQYAYRCVIAKQRKKMMTWEGILRHRRDRIAYVHAYQLLLRSQRSKEKGDCLVSDRDLELAEETTNDIELRLGVNAVMFFRALAQLSPSSARAGPRNLTKESQTSASKSHSGSSPLGRVESSSSSWLRYYWPSRSSSSDQKVGETSNVPACDGSGEVLPSCSSDPRANEQSAFSPESLLYILSEDAEKRDELARALDLDLRSMTSREGGALPADYVKYSFAIEVDQLRAVLLGRKGSPPLVEICIGDIGADATVYDKLQVYTFQAMSMRVRDPGVSGRDVFYNVPHCGQPKRSKESQGSSPSPFLRVVVKTVPGGESKKVTVGVSVGQVVVVMVRSLLDRVLLFFQKMQPVDLDDLHRAASRRLHTVMTATRRALRQKFQDMNRAELSVNVLPPRVVFPEDETSLGSTVCLVVDLGHVSVRSVLRPGEVDPNVGDFEGKPRVSDELVMPVECYRILFVDVRGLQAFFVEGVCPMVLMEAMEPSCCIHSKHEKATDAQCFTTKLIEEFDVTLRYKGLSVDDERALDVVDDEGKPAVTSSDATPEKGSTFRHVPVPNVEGFSPSYRYTSSPSSNVLPNTPLGAAPPNVSKSSASHTGSTDEGDPPKGECRWYYEGLHIATSAKHILTVTSNELNFNYSAVKHGYLMRIIYSIFRPTDLCAPALHWSNVDKAGYLYLRDIPPNDDALLSHEAWRPRWCVVRGDDFFVFESAASTVYLLRVRLSECTVVMMNSEPPKTVPASDGPCETCPNVLCLQYIRGGYFPAMMRASPSDDDDLTAWRTVLTNAGDLARKKEYDSLALAYFMGSNTTFFAVDCKVNSLQIHLLDEEECRPRNLCDSLLLLRMSSVDALVTRRQFDFTLHASAHRFAIKDVFAMWQADQSSAGSRKVHRNIFATPGSTKGSGSGGSSTPLSLDPELEHLLLCDDQHYLNDDGEFVAFRQNGYRKSVKFKLTVTRREKRNFQKCISEILIDLSRVHLAANPDTIGRVLEFSLLVAMRSYAAYEFASRLSRNNMPEPMNDTFEEPQHRQRVDSDCGSDSGSEVSFTSALSAGTEDSHQPDTSNSAVPPLGPTDGAPANAGSDIGDDVDSASWQSLEDRWADVDGSSLEPQWWPSMQLHPEVLTTKGAAEDEIRFRLGIFLRQLSLTFHDAVCCRQLSRLLLRESHFSLIVRYSALNITGSHADPVFLDLLANDSPYPVFICPRPLEAEANPGAFLWDASDRPDCGDGCGVRPRGRPLLAHVYERARAKSVHGSSIVNWEYSRYARQWLQYPGHDHILRGSIKRLGVVACRVHIEEVLTYVFDILIHSIMAAVRQIFPVAPQWYEAPDIRLASIPNDRFLKMDIRASDLMIIVPVCTYSPFVCVAFVPRASVASFLQSSEHGKQPTRGLKISIQEVSISTTSFLSVTEVPSSGKLYTTNGDPKASSNGISVNSPMALPNHRYASLNTSPASQNSPEPSSPRMRGGGSATFLVKESESDAQGGTDESFGGSGVNFDADHSSVVGPVVRNIETIDIIVLSLPQPPGGETFEVDLSGVPVRTVRVVLGTCPLDVSLTIPQLMLLLSVFEQNIADSLGHRGFRLYDRRLLVSDDSIPFVWRNEAMEVASAYQVGSSASQRDHRDNDVQSKIVQMQFELLSEGIKASLRCGPSTTKLSEHLLIPETPEFMRKRYVSAQSLNYPSLEVELGGVVSVMRKFSNGTVHWNAVMSWLTAKAVSGTDPAGEGNCDSCSSLLRIGQHSHADPERHGPQRPGHTGDMAGKYASDDSRYSRTRRDFKPRGGLSAFDLLECLLLRKQLSHCGVHIEVVQTPDVDSVPSKCQREASTGVSDDHFEQPQPLALNAVSVEEHMSYPPTSKLCESNGKGCSLPPDIVRDAFHGDPRRSKNDATSSTENLRVHPSRGCLATSRGSALRLNATAVVRHVRVMCAPVPIRRLLTVTRAPLRHLLRLKHKLPDTIPGTPHTGPISTTQDDAVGKHQKSKKSSETMGRDPPSPMGKWYSAAPDGRFAYQHENLYLCDNFFCQTDQYLSPFRRIIVVGNDSEPCAPAPSSSTSNVIYNGNNTVLDLTYSQMGDCVRPTPLIAIAPGKRLVLKNVRLRYRVKDSLDALVFRGDGAELRAFTSDGVIHVLVGEAEPAKPVGPNDSDFLFGSAGNVSNFSENVDSYDILGASLRSQSFIGTPLAMKGQQRYRHVSPDRYETTPLRSRSSRGYVEPRGEEGEGAKYTHLSLSVAMRECKLFIPSLQLDGMDENQDQVFHKSDGESSPPDHRDFNDHRFDAASSCYCEDPTAAVELSTSAKVRVEEASTKASVHIDSLLLSHQLSRTGEGLRSRRSMPRIVPSSSANVSPSLTRHLSPPNTPGVDRLVGTSPRLTPMPPRRHNINHSVSMPVVGPLSCTARVSTKGFGLSARTPDPNVSSHISIPHVVFNVSPQEILLLGGVFVCLGQIASAFSEAPVVDHPPTADDEKGPPHLYSVKARIEIKHLCVRLLNARGAGEFPLLQALLSAVRLDLKHSPPVESQKDLLEFTSFKGTLKAVAKIDFFNPLVADWEPVLEPWPITLTLEIVAVLDAGDSTKKVSVLSHTVAEVNVSHALLSALPGAYKLWTSVEDHKNVDGTSYYSYYVRNGTGHSLYVSSLPVAEAESSSRGDPLETNSASATRTSDRLVSATKGWVAVEPGECFPLVSDPPSLVSRTPAESLPPVHPQDASTASASGSSPPPPRRRLNSLSFRAQVDDQAGTVPTTSVKTRSDSEDLLSDLPFAEVETLLGLRPVPMHVGIRFPLDHHEAKNGTLGEWWTSNSLFGTYIQHLIPLQRVGSRVYPVVECTDAIVPDASLSSVVCDVDFEQGSKVLTVRSLYTLRNCTGVSLQVEVSRFGSRSAVVVSLASGETFNLPLGRFGEQQWRRVRIRPVGQDWFGYAWTDDGSALWLNDFMDKGNPRDRDATPGGEPSTRASGDESSSSGDVLVMTSCAPPDSDVHMHDDNPESRIARDVFNVFVMKSTQSMGGEPSASRSPSSVVSREPCEWEFHAPLTVSNLLSCDVSLSVLAGKPTLFSRKFRKVSGSAVSCGSVLSCFSLNRTENWYLEARLPGKWIKCAPTCIYQAHVPSGGKDHDKADDVSRDSPGAYLPRYEVMTIVDEQGEELSLRLEISTTQMGSVSVALYCPYWIINKSDCVLYYSPARTNIFSTTLAPGMLVSGADTTESFLYSTDKLSIRVGRRSKWSTPFSLEAVGTSGTVQVVSEPSSDQDSFVPAATDCGDEGDNATGDGVGTNLEPEGAEAKLIRSSGFGRRHTVSPGGVGLRRTHSTLPRVSSERDATHLERPKSFASSFDDTALPDHTSGKEKSCNEQANSALGGVVSRAPALYEFGVSLAMAEGKFRRTKVVTITPRFVLVNHTRLPLSCAQAGMFPLFNIMPTPAYSPAPRSPHTLLTRVLKKREAAIRALTDPDSESLLGDSPEAPSYATQACAADAQDDGPAGIKTLSGSSTGSSPHAVGHHRVRPSTKVGLSLSSRRRVLHWSRSKMSRTLSIKPTDQRWQYSKPFDLSRCGDFFVQCRHRGHPNKVCVIHVVVQSHDSIAFVYFTWAGNFDPLPYGMVPQHPLEDTPHRRQCDDGGSQRGARRKLSSRSSAHNMLQNGSSPLHSVMDLKFNRGSHRTPPCDWELPSGDSGFNSSAEPRIAPPYRIVNDTWLVLSFHQKGFESLAMPLLPFESTPFTWENHEKDRKVVAKFARGKLSLLSLAKQFSQLHTSSFTSNSLSYPLDELTTFPEVQIEVSSGSGYSRGDASTGSLRHSDTEEHTIYVAVEADGPTRVLRFWMKDTGKLFAAEDGKGESRIQDISREPQGLTDRVRLSVVLPGFGISIIDSRVTEILYARIEDISFRYFASLADRKCEFRIRNVQVDDQSIETRFPVLLSRASEDPEYAVDMPFMQVVVVQNLEKPGILLFDYASLLVQAFDICVENVFLLRISNFFVSLLPKGGNEEAFLAKLRSNSFDDEGCPIDGSTFGPTSRRVYFELLQLHPVKANVSLTNVPPPRQLFDEGIAIANPVSSFLGTFGGLMQVDRAPLRLNALVLEHPFESTRALSERIGKHYFRELLVEFYKIIGSAEVLGNPVLLISSIGTGVFDFFYEPAQGFSKGPEHFARGLAKGTLSLLKNSVHGMFNAASKMTENVGQGIASLSMDDDYLRDRAAGFVVPANASEGFRHGARALKRGVFKGVSGLVKQPVKGAMSGGAEGFVKGVGKGLIGVMVKPAAGLADFASKTAQGIRNAAYLVDRPSNARSRPPRCIEPDGVLRCFDWDRAIGQDLLVRLVGRRKASKTRYVHHVVFPLKKGREAPSRDSRSPTSTSPSNPRTQAWAQSPFREGVGVVLLTNCRLFLTTDASTVAWSIPYHDILDVHAEDGRTVFQVLQKQIFGSKAMVKSMSLDCGCDENAEQIASKTLHAMAKWREMSFQ